MPTARATIDTVRADRYLSQLCDHLERLPQQSQRHGTHGGHPGAPQVLHIERAQRHAVITFVWGTCTLDATATALQVRLEAPEATTLATAEALVAHRLQTIGSRVQLTVEWQHDPTHQ